MKLKDALSAYTDYSYKMAVWEEVMQHLRTFLSEGGVEADKRIETDFGPQGHVPDQVIQGLMREIAEGPLEALEAEITSLEELDVAGPKERKDKKKLPASGSKAARGKTGLAKSAGRRKPLRAVQ